MNNNKPLLLELFCGTKSIGKEFQKVGFNVISSDFDPKFNPTFVADILNLDPHDFVGLGIDVLWASPPCNAFSVAVIGRNWHHDHTPKNDTARLGLAILEKTVEFVKVLSASNPNLQWWFENPRGKMRKMPVVQEFNRLNEKGESVPTNTVTYCQYEQDRPASERRMKPTDLWSNTGWKARPICKNGDPCHEAAPRGSRTGTQGITGSMDRSVIPPDLCRDIAEYALQNISERNATDDEGITSSR